MRVGEVVWHNCLPRLLSCTAQCVVVETGHGTILERWYYMGGRMTTNTNGAIKGGGGGVFFFFFWKKVGRVGVERGG